MKEKIRLLVVIPNKSGVGYYRSMNPHIFMDEKYPDEVEVTLTEKFEAEKREFGLDYDVVHFHSNTSVEYSKLADKITQLQSNGVKVVIDLDDYWILPSYFPQYQMYNKQQKAHERTIALIKICDYVTTTTNLFANEIKKHNKNVFVFPNAINPAEKQFIPTKKESDRLRVGIVCGSSHEKDVDLLHGMVNQLKPEIDRLQFVVCGFDLRGEVQYRDPKTEQIKTRPIRPDETVWTRYESIFTDKLTTVSDEYKRYLLTYNSSFDYPNVMNEPYRRCWTKPVNQYATHYNDIDVLLVPLVDNKFNQMKSQLKVVESGFFNKAIIAQDFGPYQIDLKSYMKKGGEIDETGNALLVDSSKNHKMWAKHIKFLLNNPEHRKKMADNLNNDITPKYNIETVTRERLSFYKQIANKQ